MANELTAFVPGQIPAHIQALNDREAGNIQDRASTPSLSYGGKQWAITLNGETTVMTKKDDDGERVPLQVMKVIILNFAPHRGRAFYEGAYDSKNPLPPTCWSDDSKTPDKSIDEPQAAKCDGCPMSAKGSKVNDKGQATTACQQHLMLAVVPAANPKFTPLRMKLAITSIYDDRSPQLEAQNWFSFDKYKAFLRTNNCKHSASVVTKLKFDPNEVYPKVIFQAASWLEEGVADECVAIGKTDEVMALLGRAWTPAGVDGKRVEGPKNEPEVDAAAAVKAALAAETARLAKIEADAAKAKAQKAAEKKAAAEAKAAEEAAAAAAAEAAKKEKFITPAMDGLGGDDDGDDDLILPGAASVTAAKADKPKADKPKPADKPKAAPAAATAPAAVAALLDDWDD